METWYKKGKETILFPPKSNIIGIVLDLKLISGKIAANRLNVI